MKKDRLEDLVIEQESEETVEERLTRQANKIVRRLQKQGLHVSNVQFNVVDGTDECTVEVYQRRADHFDVVITKRSTRLVEL